MMITLSVCIPTYNRAELLHKTLEVILPQVSDGTVEIIISDNASNDNTQGMIAELQKKSAAIKYYRNEENFGLDANTLMCIQRASGKYCWLCSDDDIPLPGSLEKILAVIRKYSPSFIYLNYAGFIENEPYDVVLCRAHDVEDKLYDDPQEMIRELRLNHFSASIARRELILEHNNIIHDYKARGFERGYFLAINHYLILNNPGPYIFIGRLSLAVRNPISVVGNSYNPLTTLIDVARHYQKLQQDGMISRYTEEYVLNWYLLGFYRVVLPMKCFGLPGYTTKKINLIVHLCKKYRNFLYLYWALVLPRWSLIFPYWLGRNIKKGIRRIFNTSPF